MKKVTQKTYLPELFLNKLNGDFSQKAVLRALELCGITITAFLDNIYFILLVTAVTTLL